MQMEEGQRERERVSESQAGSTHTTEPNMALEPRNCELMT